MDLFPTVQEAAAHVRRVYEMGVNCFDCAHSYWSGKSDKAYGLGLSEVRKNIFLTSKSTRRDRKQAEDELHLSLKRLKTDYLDIWQMHSVQSQSDIDRIFSTGGAMESVRSREEGRKVPLHRIHGTLRSRSPRADVEGPFEVGFRLMPIHAADHAYLSFETAACG